jgi:hypothetical protein
MLSILLLIISCIGSTVTPENSIGQAEETFGQNSTFLEEVDQIQKSQMTIQDQETPALNQIQTKSGVSKGSSGPEANIVVSGENAYIVWATNETGNFEVMLRASNDGGETFGAKINLSNSSDRDSENVEVAASGNRVFVVWHENNPDNSSSESVLRISDDNGQTFGPFLRLAADGKLGESQTFSKFENSTYGIQMQYPADWEVTMGEDDNTNVIDIAGFTSPLEYRLDNYEERLWISLENLRSQNLTLEEYKNNVVNYKNETLADFLLLDNDTDSAVLGGHPAYRLVYTSELEDGTILKQMEIGTKIGNKVYYLDYYAQGEKYSEFLPIIQEMINSFEIEEKE